MLQILCNACCREKWKAKIVYFFRSLWLNFTCAPGLCNLACGGASYWAITPLKITGANSCPLLALPICQFRTAASLQKKTDSLSISAQENARLQHYTLTACTQSLPNNLWSHTSLGPIITLYIGDPISPQTNTRLIETFLQLFKYVFITKLQCCLFGFGEIALNTWLLMKFSSCTIVLVINVNAGN